MRRRQGHLDAGPADGGGSAGSRPSGPYARARARACVFKRVRVRARGLKCESVHVRACRAHISVGVRLLPQSAVGTIPAVDLDPRSSPSRGH